MAESPDEPDYVALLSELHDSHVDFQENRQQIHLMKTVPQAKFVLVYGLACHADLLTAEVMPMLDEKDPRPRLAAVPIVRSMFEAGLTAQWLTLVPLAELRLAKKHRDVYREMTSEMHASKVPLIKEMAARRDQYDEQGFLTDPSMPVSSGIKPICDSLVEGHSLYLLYRILCGHVHAGIEAAELWVSGDAGAASGFRVRHSPQEEWGALLDAIAFWSSLWAARALDDIVMNNPRRNLLNRIRDKGQSESRLHLKR